MHYLLGIDLGTSSLKTLIISIEGKILTSAAVDYQYDSPLPGYAEQDPQVWWNACVNSIRNAIYKAGINAKDIAAVGFSGQMHGVVTLDEEFHVIRPAILHCDTRSEAQVRVLYEHLSPAKIQSLFRNPLYTGFMLTSLLWIHDNENENFKRIAHVCSPKDYLRYLLTGVFTSEYSDASATLLFDIEHNCWSDEILSLTRLPHSVFPACTESTAIVGYISRKASELTGLPEKTPAAAGGGDLSMMCAGNGLVRDGAAIVNIGTSGQISFLTNRTVINPELNTNIFTSYRSDRWILYGANMSAGLCLKWWQKITGNPSFQTINKAVSNAAPGSGGLIFYPYLNGERCPHLMPDISSCFIGVNASSGFAEMTRAVMEGVVFNLKQSADICEKLGFSADMLIASGGAARSDVWTQIMADVFNKPVKRIIGEEQACLGAAMTAGIGIGVWNSFQEAADAAVRYQDCYMMPIPQNTMIYNDYYQIFKDTFPQFKENLRRLTILGRKHP